MATPVGHYLLGLSITQALATDRNQRRRGMGWALVACLPDADFLPGIIVGDFARFHHGASHSLTAAALFSLAVWLSLRWWTRKVIASAVLVSFVLYVSHSLLDYFTLDGGEPYGIPLFWPWQLETYQSPWSLLPHVQHTRAPIVSSHNMLLILREIILFLPLLGLIRSLKTGPGPSPRMPAWLYASWLVSALWASAVSLR